MYKRHCAVVVGIQNDGLLPEFGKVEDILVADNELYFHVQLCLTMRYSEHYHALVFVIERITVPLLRLNSCHTYHYIFVLLLV